MAKQTTNERALCEPVGNPVDHESQTVRQTAYRRNWRIAEVLNYHDPTICYRLNNSNNDNDNDNDNYR